MAETNLIRGEAPTTRVATKAKAAKRCRRKFLDTFPGGFRDPTYLDWERDYKWEAHERWENALDRRQFRVLLRSRAFAEIAARAVRVEQRTRHSMLFSFEKMALRDAVRSAERSAHEAGLDPHTLDAAGWRAHWPTPS